MVDPSVIRIPLQGSRIRATGETAVKAVLPISVKTQQGPFEPFEFLIDTGSSVSTIPLTVARRLHVLIPRRTITIEVQTAAGMVRQRRHPGQLVARVPGFEGKPFVWPCHFVDHPSAPPVCALGLAGVLNDLKITFDGTYALEAPYGWLVLERQR